MCNQLYQVNPTDLVTFGAVGLAVLLVVVAACWLPRWAANVNATDALRLE